MQQNTKDLFSKVIIRQYVLPDDEHGINKSNLSTHVDHCLSCNDCEQLSELIGCSLIDYCFDEAEQQNKDVKSLLNIALNTRVKIKLESEKESALLKQGFFGEALLYTVLLSCFGAGTLICRGRLINPSSRGETPGYDAFHIIEQQDEINLWFGEVKFYMDYKSAIRSVVESMKKSLSLEYLHTNLMAIINHENYLHSAKMTSILNNWKENGFLVTLGDLISKENIKLVYPALIIYDDKNVEYDEIIKKSIQVINEEAEQQNISIPDFCSVFFVLLPISDTRKTKLDVIEWIKTKRR